MTDGPSTPESAIPHQSSNTLQAQEGLFQEQNQISPTSTEQSPVKETELTNQVLVSFLEKQKYSVPEGQSLTSNQQEFNKKIDHFIENLNQNSNQPINLENFFQALNYGYQKSLPEQIEQIESLIKKTQEKINDSQTPQEQKKELQQKIEFLKQIKEQKEKLLENASEIPEEIKKHIETVFNELDTNQELKQQLIAALNNGSFDQVMEIFVNEGLKDNEGDAKETKEKKADARKLAENLRKYGLPIGGIFGILLLLMIFRASKQNGGGGGGMMG